MDRETRVYLGKVALKTFCLLLAIVVLACSIFMIAFPTKTSNLMFKLGMNKLSCDFQKMQYERSKDFNDLALLFDRAVDGEKYEYQKKYGKELLNNENLEDYAIFRVSRYGQPHYIDYVTGNYVIGLYECGDKGEALKVIVDSSTNYYIGCGMSLFATHLAEKVSKESIKDIYNDIMKAYEDIYTVCVSNKDADIKNLSSDAYSIAEKCGDQAYMDVWESRY